MLLHYTNGYREDYGHVFSKKFDFNYGYLGVQFFFIISGFVIFLTLNHSKSAIDFLYKRFSRLYPIFWACMFTTFFITYWFGLPGRTVSFYNLKGNITMIPSVFHLAAVDGAYWSLVPEFFFYLAMAFIFLTKKKQAYYYWGIAILALSWLQFFFHPFNLFLETALNLKWGSLFFSGILFYEYRENNSRSYAFHLLLMITYATTLMNLSTNAERIIVTIFYAIFFFFAQKKLDNIHWRPLIFLGQISFPLYLLHQNIGYVILNQTRAFLGQYPFLFVVTPILLLVTMAYLYHRFIERPSIILFRQMQTKIFKNSH